MFRRLAAALLLRRISRTLDALAASVAAQTALLADRFAPLLPVDSPTDRTTLRADTGVTHLDTDDASLALAYIARIQAHTGHIPDEEEVLMYLADEKTQDLAERLATRDEELTRLMEARR
jgi:hypothetical protein